MSINLEAIKFKFPLLKQTTFIGRKLPISNTIYWGLLLISNRHRFSRLCGCLEVLCCFEMNFSWVCKILVLSLYNLSKNVVSSFILWVGLSYFHALCFTGLVWPEQRAWTEERTMIEASNIETNLETKHHTDDRSYDCSFNCSHSYLSQNQWQVQLIQ